MHEASSWVVRNALMDNVAMAEQSAVERIANTLDHIADEHSVQLHYACESGSRAWGFASEDSDFDVRFIFVRPLEDYLVLKPRRDVIELPIIDDLDVKGWDIFKACRLLQKSNPSLIEWLGSPTVYIENTGLPKQLRDQAQEHFSARACCEHSRSMATSIYKKYVNDRDVVIRKKYLYILRPIACIRWMLTHNTFAPTVFADVLSGVDLSSDVHREIELLLHDKRKNHEMGEAPANPTLDAFIRGQLDSLPESIRGIDPRVFPSDGLNDLIRSVLLG